MLFQAMETGASDTPYGDPDEISFIPNGEARSACFMLRVSHIHIHTMKNRIAWGVWWHSDLSHPARAHRLLMARNLHMLREHVRTSCAASLLWQASGPASNAAPHGESPAFVAQPNGTVWQVSTGEAMQIDLLQDCYISRYGKA